MAYRDDHAAAEHRVEILERRVAELEDENRRLASGEASAAPRPGVFVTGVLVALAGAAGIAVGVATSVAALVVGGLLCTGLGSGFAVIGAIVLASPSELLVISGRRRRIVSGGRGFVVPLLERVDRLSLANMVITAEVRGARCRDGAEVDIDAVGNVRLATAGPRRDNAIERFLGHRRDEIAGAVRELFEPALRAVAAGLTADQLRDDRLAVADAMARELEADCDRLGVVVDGLKIQRVS